MSKQKIQLLDALTINQIAAGEVIENVASVVKELVENALDAGARTILVETQGGGRGWLRVTDDGSGIDEAELPLALERHATSKLRSFSDLEQVASLGFRGEALPSIAAISKLSLHSATAEGAGKLLYAEGGKVVSIRSAPRRPGTTVEVNALFFNVPVRKAFQKSVAADTTEIHKLLTKCALCYEGVAFTWVAEGKEQFSCAATLPIEGRIALLLGEGCARALLPVVHHESSFHLTGFCSDLSLHRPNRTGQYLFINRRIVASLLISSYVSEAYATRLSSTRYPLFVLHLTLPAEALDVNVHPQKREVRLREEAVLSPFVRQAIARALTPPVASARLREARPFWTSLERPSTSLPQVAHYQMVPPPLVQPTLFAMPRPIVATVGRYLVLAEPEGLRVIDRMAARLRILYEQLIEPTAQAIQPLLIPLQLEVTGAEQRLLADHLADFEALGFSLRSFGPNTFIVEAIPSLLSQEEATQFIHAFIEKGELPREKKVASALRKILQWPAELKGEGLVEALFRCKEPDYTPEGKPIHYLLTEKALSQAARKHEENPQGGITVESVGG